MGEPSAVEKLFHQPGLSDSPAAPDEHGATPPRATAASTDGSEQLVEETELGTASDESIHCEKPPIEDAYMNESFIYESFAS